MQHVSHACPRCGSENVRRSHRPASGHKLGPAIVRVYRCRKCGARFRNLATFGWALLGAGGVAALALVAWGLVPASEAIPDPGDLAERIALARDRHGIDEYARATRYLAGDGVPRDLTHAVALFERAAQDGNVAAQYRLGLLLRDGIGVVADAERAMTWLRLAADAAHPAAQFELGRLYLEGRGIPRDPTRAYAWLSLAAAQKVDGAQQARAAALAGLAPDEIAAAKAEARRIAEVRLPPGIELDF